MSLGSTLREDIFSPSLCIVHLSSNCFICNTVFITMISGIFSRLAILTLGTLYPAYASFKAVRAKNVQEYVKWMMYWIVFAIFTTIETFTDLFLPWFPFYHELKVVIVLWLLSPVTNGSSILYRKCVHPMLMRKEPEIDQCITRVRERGYATLLQLANRVFHYVSDFVMHVLQRNFRMVGQPHTLMSGSKSMGRLAEVRAIATSREVSSMPRSMSLHGAIIEECSVDEFELRELHYDLQTLTEPSGSRTRASNKKILEETTKGSIKGKKPAAGGRGRGRKPKERASESGEE